MAGAWKRSIKRIRSRHPQAVAIGCTMNVPSEVYQLHIWICAISPMIWRRVLVRNTKTGYPNLKAIPQSEVLAA